MPANLVFRRKIWGARDNGIPPRSTPVDLLCRPTRRPNKKSVFNLSEQHIQQNFEYRAI